MFVAFLSKRWGETRLKRRCEEGGLASHWPAAPHGHYRSDGGLCGEDFVGTRTHAGAESLLTASPPFSSGAVSKDSHEGLPSV